MNTYFVRYLKKKAKKAPTFVIKVFFDLDQKSKVFFHLREGKSQ